MEKFQELRAYSKKKLDVADHMLSVTYPLLKDVKLLVAVMENTFLAYTNAMSSVLHYDRMFHKIPAFEDNFESKFNMFKQKSMVRHGINHKYLEDMQKIKILLMEHRKSPVEFSKKDKFVICSDKFDVKTISVKDMQRYKNNCRLFIQDVSSVTSKNEDIFRRT